MNTLLIAAITTILAATGPGGVKKEMPPDPVQVEGVRIAFSLPDLEGNSVSLTDKRFEGKVVMVALWGTWCGTCRSEIPLLKKLQDKYKDQGFEIIGVSFENLDTDEAWARVAAFVETQKLNYLVLKGGLVEEVEAKIEHVKGHRGFPTSFFVGRDGTFRHAKEDYVAGEDDAKIEGIIEGLLKETAPSGK